MEFNKLVFAGLSIGCLAAAAGGSYLAVRQNQTAVSGASGAALDVPAALDAPAAPGAAVTESEGVITQPFDGAQGKPASGTAPRTQTISQVQATTSRASSARPAAAAPRRSGARPTSACSRAIASGRGEHRGADRSRAFRRNDVGVAPDGAAVGP